MAVLKVSYQMARTVFWISVIVSVPKGLLTEIKQKVCLLECLKT